MAHNNCHDGDNWSPLYRYIDFMGDDSRALRLREFTQYVRDHITGDEKGEAQVYLDRLFRAFGQRGVREA
jgi:hypothetical protein